MLLARPYIILKKAIMPDLAQTRIADAKIGCNILRHKAEDTGNFISVRERQSRLMKVSPRRGKVIMKRTRILASEGKA